MKFIRPLPATEYDIKYKINSNRLKFYDLEKDLAKRFDSIGLWRNNKSENRRLLFLNQLLRRFHIESFLCDNFYHHILFDQTSKIRKRSGKDIFMLTRTPRKTLVTMTLGTFDELLRGYYYEGAHRDVCADPDALSIAPGSAVVHI
jgi:hypothetical protein